MRASKMIKKILFMFVLGALISQAAIGAEDTRSNREAAVKRYIEAVSIEEMMGDMAEAMAMNFPPDKRDGFKKFMLEYVDHSVIEASTKAAMVRHFTVAEIDAMADFFSRPAAQSAMKKFGFYMADIMPMIEAEMMRAMGQFQKAMAEENRNKPSE